MKPNKPILALTAAALMLTQQAFAQGYEADGTFYDYAKVLDVEPIVSVVRVQTPQRECWDEEVVHRAPRRGYHAGAHSFTPAILGGILGGVVGNQFGHGSGKTAMTVGGALLGASVGNDLARRSHRAYGRGHTYTYTTTEERCRVTNAYHEEERIDGYRVRYRYKGEIFQTLLDHDPGPRLRVRVQLSPETVY